MNVFGSICPNGLSVEVRPKASLTLFVHDSTAATHASWVCLRFSPYCSWMNIIAPSIVPMNEGPDAWVARKTDDRCGPDSRSRCGTILGLAYYATPAGGRCRL